MNWERCAKAVEEIYGGYVDREEEFFHCPNCDEPIYKCDWQETDFNPNGGMYTGHMFCPVCEEEIELI